MKLKEEKKELDALLKASTPAMGNANAAVTDVSIDDSPEELQEEPLFIFKYKKEKQKYYKKAYESVKKIVLAIVKKEEYVNCDFVRDKIEQDADQLGNLYYQQAMILAVEQSNMESIRTGNASPRMYETFTMLSKNHSDISQQISDFQTELKDNYSKIRFDLMDQEEMNLGDSSGKGTETKKLEDQNIFYGTKAILDNIKQAKIKLLETENVVDSSYQEVKDEEKQE